MIVTDDIKMVVTHDRQERQPYNSTYPKVAVQRFNEALCTPRRIHR
jgi:hypothetical protein